jgi:uncharacterized protein (TIGR02757 family)
MLIDNQLKPFLDNKVQQYQTLDFIADDPISVPHAFTRKKDIEIAGLLSASLAWGNRKAIIKSARQWMQWMDNQPYDFIINATKKDKEPFKKFIYRTFNGVDCLFFIDALKYIYEQHQGLEAVFTKGYQQEQSVKGALEYFRTVFFSSATEGRTGKHVASPAKGSAAKRLNMYLRWMVRSDNSEVDFGLWKHIPASSLMIPLDVHTGHVARHLGLLQRKQNDWRAVGELTQALRTFDSTDPVKYDYALFGIGVNKDF